MKSSVTDMIPKKIHYCWFGRGKKPALAEKCIASWHKYCPEYEIIEWNEDNFDVRMNGYTSMCYDHKKYAYLSDYVRLYVVCQHGGLYFDTDVELLRNPDFLLKDTAFFGFETGESSGFFENSKEYGKRITTASVATGLAFGSVAKGAAIEAMLHEYDALLDGKHGVTGCPELNTMALVPFGLKRDGSYQELSCATIYPKEYFNPYESATGRLLKTENTVSIHWYMGSCLTAGQKLRSRISRPFHRIFGVDCFRFLKQ